ncbi:MAG: site-specific integrase [Desulfovibrionaceae bacterium]|nr:site-specific integrase [Desulfovibrionaceae bacterium]
MKVVDKVVDSTRRAKNVARFSWINSEEHTGVRYHVDPDRPRLKGGRYDRLYGIRFQVDGKRHEVLVGWASEGMTEGRAADERKRLMDQAKEGGAATKRQERELLLAKRKEEERLKRLEESKNVTFKAFAEDEYFPIALPGWKPETGRKHVEHCKTWLYPQLGDVPLREITIQHVNKIKAALLKAERAPRTMQAVFRTFSMVWNAARDAGIVEGKCPTALKSFKLPKVDNEKQRYLSPKESEKLLKCVRARSEQAADMALVSLESGLRFGEIAALTWGAVDLEGRTLLAMNTKGKKDRVVPMTERLHGLLSGMEHGGDGELVFPTRLGTKHKQVPSAFVRGIADSKLNQDVDDPKMKVSFHTLRHSYASRLVKQGVSLYHVQKLLGHSTPVMTARYSKLANEDLTNAVRVMEDGEKAAAAEKKGGGKVVSMKKAGGVNK